MHFITSENIGFILSIITLLGWVYKLSSKYHSLLNELELYKKELSTMQNTLKDLQPISSRLITIENNYGNLKDSIVVKTDIAKMETEVHILKLYIEEIKTNLKEFKESFKVNNNIGQDLSKSVSKLEIQYTELKEIIKSRNVL